MYLVGKRTGSSLTVSMPCFDPMRVLYLIRATEIMQYKMKSKVDGISKLKAEKFIFSDI